MATSAASAAGSDSNRAGYARNLESSLDSNRLRIDESSISAFDLLLDLPIFENQIPVAPTDSEYESVNQQETDDESRLDEYEVSHQENGPSPSLVPIPIVQRIQETPERHFHPTPSDDRKVDTEPVRAVGSPQDKDSKEKPALEVNRESKSVHPSEDLNSEGVDPLPTSLPDNTQPEPSKLASQNALVAESALTRGPVKLTEENDQDSLDGDLSLQDRNEKGSKTLPSDGAVQADSLDNTSTLQPAADSTLPKKFSKRDIDSESPKATTSTTPVVNRRAERLAESKRGESTKNDSEKDERELPESLSSHGRLEIPSELNQADEPVDSTQTLDALNAQTVSEQTSSSGTLPEASSTLPSNSSPIIGSGIVTAAPSSTSVAGMDGNKGSIVSGVSGSQGTTSFSGDAATRSSTPLTGRVSTLTPYQEHRVLQRVLKGLEQFDNGGGSVRLRLHPPELGSLQITLRVEAQQVSALVEVEHSAARDVLLSNLPQLQSRLAEQGLNVSQFDVQVVDSNQWSQGSSQGWEAGNGQGTNQNDSESKRSSRYSDRLQNQLERAPTADMNPSGQPLWTRKNGQIDVRV